MRALDITLNGRRFVIGCNSEQKRWAVHRESLFTALLCWPLLIGTTRNAHAVRGKPWRIRPLVRSRRQRAA